MNLVNPVNPVKDPNGILEQRPEGVRGLAAAAIFHF